ncbi:MAG: HAD hydrolase family protein [Desulfobacteraceae bacterium]|nr:HAD hydrolase family protein [Desulfobacteraceae bacterium]MBC2757072.1 HAD hydrolase family protein [Desulfobacteraceae bacterium]MBC2763711.1 HAD hydrolase family protein [ANME-2 cluster archaeon]
MNGSKLEYIKLLLLDVDGVLTSGHIIYSGADIETKMFNVKDGLGIRLLQSAGIDVGIITGRTSKALLIRCGDLGITMIYDGIKSKGDIFDTILSATHLQAHEVAFVGDDLPDISLMKKVGISIAVGDAHDAVKKNADITTRRNGGEGAVREVCEMILDAKNLLEKIIENCI